MEQNENRYEKLLEENKKMKQEIEQLKDNSILLKEIENIKKILVEQNNKIEEIKNNTTPKPKSIYNNESDSERNGGRRRFK
jgi:cell division septum initiation protein DivIVA